MPDAAIKALEGKLAEGVDPLSVIEDLQAAGWTPPEGDAGYDEGSEGPPSADSETPPPGTGEDEEAGGPPEGPKGMLIALSAKPGEMNERRKSAAQAAMKKDGYKGEEEE